MATITHLQPGLTHISDAIISVRHELGVLRADIMERFDQNAAATAALHGRISQVEDNVTTHCNLDALNNAVAQSRDVLNTVATDVVACRGGLQSVETAVIACRQAVEDHQSHLLNRVNTAQETVTQAMSNTRQELSGSITTLRDNILDAVGTARHEINTTINTLRSSVASMVDGLGLRLDKAREAIITETSLTRSPSRDVLNDKTQEIENVIEHTNASVQGLPNTLRTSLAEAMVTAASDAAEDTKKIVNENLQQLHTELNDKIQEVQLEMRAGHFNSAARLANKLSSCCTNTIVRLRGIDNLPIHTLPKTYAGLQDLQGKQHTKGDETEEDSVTPPVKSKLSAHTGNIDEILERFQLRTNVPYAKKRQQLKIYLGLRK